MAAESTNSGRGRGAAGDAYASVLADLNRGRYAPGGRLPGERLLAAAIGVSRATLRQALGRLADEGHVTRSAQRGWFVHRPVVSEPPSVLQSFTEMARAKGLRPSAHVLLQAVRTATLEEAERLRVAPATPVLHVVRIRGLDGVPVCIETTVLLRARVEPLVTADLSDKSLFGVLKDLCGIEVSRSSYTVQAMAADRESAELLGLGNGEPVLVGAEVTYDSTGSPVLSSRVTYRGDAYRFQADLYRVD